MLKRETPRARWLVGVVAALALTGCGNINFETPEATPDPEQERILEENREKLVADSLGISITHARLPSYQKSGSNAELMCVDDIAYLNVVVRKSGSLGSSTTRAAELDTKCPIDETAFLDDETSPTTEPFEEPSR